MRTQKKHILSFIHLVVMSVLCLAFTLTSCTKEYVEPFAHNCTESPFTISSTPFNVPLKDVEIKGLKQIAINSTINVSDTDKIEIVLQVHEISFDSGDTLRFTGGKINVQDITNYVGVYNHANALIGTITVNGKPLNGQTWEGVVVYIYI